MRAKELTEILSKKEKKEFEVRLKHHSRVSLLPLYLELSENEVPTKESLFISFAQKKYRKENDYLLRNELRLLSKEIEMFLTEMEARNRFANNDICVRMWLLERMLEHHRIHEFELEWKELMKIAELKADTFSAMQLSKIYSEYRLKHTEINAAEIEMHLSLLNTQNEAIHLYLDEELSETIIKQNFLIANMRAINAKVDENKKSLIKLPVKQLKQIIEYNHLKAKSYLIRGIEKINLLIELIKLHEKTSKYRSRSPHELSNIYGNIGLEYFLQKNYSKANDYYNKAIAAVKDDVPNLGLLYNYAINTMMLGKYKTMQNIYANYKNEIEQSDKTKHRFRYFAAISFLLDNNHNKAFNLLENDLLKRPAHEYYYYRIVYAMVYFDSKEYLLAERELNNILQSIRKNKNAVFEDKNLVMVFLRLVQVVFKFSNTSSYQKKLNEISQKISDMQKDKSNFSVIIYQWLTTRIEKLIP